MSCVGSPPFACSLPPQLPLALCQGLRAYATSSPYSYTTGGYRPSTAPYAYRGDSQRGVPAYVPSHVESYLPSYGGYVQRPRGNRMQGRGQGQHAGKGAGGSMQGRGWGQHAGKGRGQHAGKGAGAACMLLCMLNLPQCCPRLLTPCMLPPPCFLACPLCNPFLLSCPLCPPPLPACPPLLCREYIPVPYPVSVPQYVQAPVQVQVVERIIEVGTLGYH